MTSKKQDHTERSRADTRLAKIDERPSRSSVYTRPMSPQMVQYIKSGMDRNEAAILAQSLHQELPEDEYALHSHRNQHASQPQPMDEELKAQLHLPLDRMDDNNPSEAIFITDPENIVTERLDNLEDANR